MDDEERTEEDIVEGNVPVREAFGDGATTQGSINIETGRGQTVEVQVGAPFTETLERVADEAHYGGFFRVFLNGSELLEPTESPATIELGMRIAITSYDKVG